MGEEQWLAGEGEELFSPVEIFWTGALLFLYVLYSDDSKRVFYEGALDLTQNKSHQINLSYKKTLRRLTHLLLHLMRTLAFYWV